MPADTPGTQDPAVAKIAALVLAVGPRLVAESRKLSTTFREPLRAPGEKIPDRRPVIVPLMVQIMALRADVEKVAVQGVAQVSARDLTVRALRETEEAIGKLGASYTAVDQASATSLLDESVRLFREAQVTSAKAATALNIKWPLQ